MPTRPAFSDYATHIFSIMLWKKFRSGEYLWQPAAIPLLQLAQLFIILGTIIVYAFMPYTLPYMLYIFVTAACVVSALFWLVIVYFLCPFQSWQAGKDIEEDLEEDYCGWVPMHKPSRASTLVHSLIPIAFMTCFFLLILFSCSIFQNYFKKLPIHLYENNKKQLDAMVNTVREYEYFYAIQSGTGQWHIETMTDYETRTWATTEEEQQIAQQLAFFPAVESTSVSFHGEAAYPVKITIESRQGNVFWLVWVPHTATEEEVINACTDFFFSDLAPDNAAPLDDHWWYAWEN